jgi:hypothetical protein
MIRKALKELRLSEQAGFQQARELSAVPQILFWKQRVTNLEKPAVPGGDEF